MKTTEVDESELAFGFHVEAPAEDGISYTVAGPCKVTRADGSVEVQDPYTPLEFEHLTQQKVEYRKTTKAKRRKENRRLGLTNARD